MQTRSILTILTLAAMTAGALTTAALADRKGVGTGMNWGMTGGKGPMMMLNFDAIDADKDGKITEAEIAAYHGARTAAIDTNGDGMLSAEELTAMQLQNMQERATRRAQMMIERFDSNRDGLLSAAEMLAGPSPARMFNRIDADGDGAISKAEAEAAQKLVQNRTGKHHGQGKGFGRAQN